MRHALTKTTTEITTKTTTPTDTTTRQLSDVMVEPVNVSVDVGNSNHQVWVTEEFQLLLGNRRTVNAADQAALIELSAYPDHIVEQALDAAREWLRKPKQKPIHSLGRWLVGTAQRKLEAEQTRGSTVSFLSDEGKYVLDDGFVSAIDEIQQPDSVPKPEPLTLHEKIWHTLLQELALQLPKATYKAWLQDTVLVAAMDDKFSIGLPSAEAKEWLENRLAPTIRRTLASLVGHPVSISFQVL